MRRWIGWTALVLSLTACGAQRPKDDGPGPAPVERMELSDDGLRIRANQGHSLANVDLKLDEAKPPQTLYHATVAAFLESIRATGLQKRSRNHVHLSSDAATATKVGSRRGKPIILQVDAAAMHQQGHLFYLSANGVWLVDAVPPQHLTFPT